MAMAKRNWRLDRDVRLQNRAIEMLNSLAYCAPEFGYTEDTVLDYQARITAVVSVCRETVKAHVWGYYMRIRQEWYLRDLVFVHVGPDNTRYTGHKDVPVWAQPVGPLYKAGRGAEIAVWQHAHFWKNGKPYGRLEGFNLPATRPVQLNLEMTQ